MMDTETTPLLLPARLDARAVADAFRAWRPGRALDFAQVVDLDSSGVALVLALRKRGVLEVLNAPPRYAQLAAAHRLT